MPELAQSGPEFGPFQKCRARLRLRSITTVGISSEARGEDTFPFRYLLISRIDMNHVGNSVFFNNQYYYLSKEQFKRTELSIQILKARTKQERATT